MAADAGTEIFGYIEMHYYQAGSSRDQKIHPIARDCYIKPVSKR
jgi:hypothetical protein